MIEIKDLERIIGRINYNFLAELVTMAEERKISPAIFEVRFTRFVRDYIDFARQDNLPTDVSKRLAEIYKEIKKKYER